MIRMDDYYYHENQMRLEEDMNNGYVRNKEPDPKILQAIRNLKKGGKNVS